ncbi:MAG: hypothetical protein QM817_15370 [Archangium sp.]
MTLAEATTIVDLVLEAHRPSTQSWGVRVLEYGRAERSGDPVRVARALGELYAEAQHTPAQKLMVERLEQNLLPQLAAALGEPEAKVRERMHREHTHFDGEAAFVEEEPQGPEAISTRPVQGPEGWEHRHNFRVYGEALVLGEAPDDVESSLTCPALNGEWHVFHSPPQGGWLRLLVGSKPPAMIAVHEASLADAPRLLSQVRSIEHTDDRFTAIVDAAARRDRRVLSALGMMQQTGRSYSFSTEERGHEWRGARDDGGKLVLVTTELDAED